MFLTESREVLSTLMDILASSALSHTGCSDGWLRRVTLATCLCTKLTTVTPGVCLNWLQPEETKEEWRSGWPSCLFIQRSWRNFRVGRIPRWKGHVCRSVWLNKMIGIPMGWLVEVCVFIQNASDRVDVFLSVS